MLELAVVVIAVVVAVAADNASAQRPSHRAWLISLGFVAGVMIVSAGLVVFGRALPG